MTKKWSSRLTFFAFVVLMVGLGSNDSLRGIFSTIFQEHFSLTTTQLGLIVTASYIGNLVFLLVGGNLSTRFSKKRVLQVLILIWMAALALFAFTSNYTVLLIGMALALGSSTLLNTTMNLITPLLFATAPGFFVNFLFFTQEIGTSGSQYILGSHADGFAFWQHTNLVLLILGAVAFVLLLFCNVPEEAAAPADAPAQKGGYDWRIIVPYVLVFGFYFIAEHGVMNWMVAYGVDGLGLPQASAAKYLSVFFGGMMIGRLCLSPLVDKLGAIKSLAAFGGVSCVLYLIGSLLHFVPHAGHEHTALFPGAAGLRRGGHDFKHRVAGRYPVQCRLRQAGGYGGLCRQHSGPAAVRAGIFHRVYAVYEILQADAEIEIK